MKIEKTNSIGAIGKVESISQSLPKTNAVDGISFIDTVMATIKSGKVSNVKQVSSSKSNVYKNYYTLDISQKGLEYIKLYGSDNIALFNSDIMFYTNDLRMIFK
jgi:hypothetical protein